MKLTKLEWHNHPDFPAVKWTELELDAINKHAVAVAEAVKDECVRIVSSEESRILSKQTGQVHDPVNINLRMVAMMLPEVADAIKALEIEP